MEFKRYYKFTRFWVGLILLLIGQVAFADIVVAPNTIIDTNTTITGETIDFTAGNFVIKKQAVLTIRDSKIIGTISPTNDTLISVDSGRLELYNNNVSLTTTGIPPDPNTESLHYFARVNLGGIVFDKNTFNIDTPYTAGLLITNIIQPTAGFKLTNNTVKNFHGVFYLLNTNNSIIDNNVLSLNSYGNIVVLGTNHKIMNNSIYFAGRDRLGNSMDILNSHDVYISNNNIYTPTCHGLWIIASENVTIDRNNINGGITYAMNILSNSNGLANDKDNYAVKFLRGKFKLANASKNVKITNNYMSQNRFGITANGVDDLTIGGNIFIQRFDNAFDRKFWTNNEILLRNINNLVWTNNLYKEAFTQVNGGDNTMTRFVAFPVTGGVVL